MLGHQTTELLVTSGGTGRDGLGFFNPDLLTFSKSLGFDKQSEGHSARPMVPRKSNTNLNHDPQDPSGLMKSHPQKRQPPTILTESFGPPKSDSSEPLSPLSGFYVRYKQQIPNLLQGSTSLQGASHSGTGNNNDTTVLGPARNHVDLLEQYQQHFHKSGEFQPQLNSLLNPQIVSDQIGDYRQQHVVSQQQQQRATSTLEANSRLSSGTTTSSKINENWAPQSTDQQSQDLQQQQHTKNVGSSLIKRHSSDISIQSNPPAKLGRTHSSGSCMSTGSRSSSTFSSVPGYDIKFRDDARFCNTYQRNNKKGGKKHLRCFPYCGRPGHSAMQACDEPLILDFTRDCSLSTPSKTVILARFVCVTEESVISEMNPLSGTTHDIKVGDRVPTSTIVASLRSSSQPLLPLFQGSLTESRVESNGGNNIEKGSFRFLERAWQYGWVAGRYRQEMQHSLRCYVMETPSQEGSEDELVCVAIANSPTFKLYSSRYRYNADNRAKSALAAAVAEVETPGLLSKVKFGPTQDQGQGQDQPRSKILLKRTSSSMSEDSMWLASINDFGEDPVINKPPGKLAKH